MTHNYNSLYVRSERCTTMCTLSKSDWHTCLWAGLLDDPNNIKLGRSQHLADEMHEGSVLTFWLWSIKLLTKNTHRKAVGCAPWASTVLCVLSRLMIRPSDYVAKATRAPRYQNILFVTNASRKYFGKHLGNGPCRLRFLSIIVHSNLWRCISVLEGITVWSNLGCSDSLSHLFEFTKCR